MRTYRLLALNVVIIGAALSGCTAVKVQPISADQPVEHICIQNNPKVQVEDFVPVMQEGFNKHGISSQVIDGAAPRGCAYTASYTARRSWDMSTYLSLAEIYVQRDGRQIASAHYHLRGKGGLALNKWASTRSKILPVIDELLAQVKTRGPVPAQAATSAAEGAMVQVSNATPPVTSELAVKLAHLKDAYDAQLISREEYDAKRKALIDNL